MNIQMRSLAINTIFSSKTFNWNNRWRRLVMVNSVVQRIKGNLFLTPKKKIFIKCGGEGGIRTLDTL